MRQFILLLWWAIWFLYYEKQSIHSKKKKNKSLNKMFKQRKTDEQRNHISGGDDNWKYFLPITEIHDNRQNRGEKFLEKTKLLNYSSNGLSIIWIGIRFNFICLKLLHENQIHLFSFTIGINERTNEPTGHFILDNYT